MSYHQVSDENMKKVEAFFVKRVKETGSNRIEATVVEIAEGSSVALATAHKAVKELIRIKTIDMVKPKSRRFPINYIYTKDINDFQATVDEKDQIEYLKTLVQDQQDTIEAQRKELEELRVQVRNHLPV